MGHPNVRTATLFALLACFALLVGFYMEVINRYVESSVQVWSSPAAEAGSSLVLRATTFRPDRRERISGTATVEVRSSEDVPSTARPQPVETGALSSFVVRVPPLTRDQLIIDLTATTGEANQHSAALEIPLRAPLDPITAVLAQRRTIRDGPTDRPRVQLVRTEPREAPWSLSLTSEGGVPVRFVENTFIVQVTRSDGTPVEQQEVELEIPAPSAPSTVTVQTDQFGLATFRATPNDLELWRLRAHGPIGTVTAAFEIVPSFDSLFLRPRTPLVSDDEPIVATLESGLSVTQFHFDIVADRVVLATATGSAHEPVGVHPPTGRWPTHDGKVRLFVIQVGSNPFSVNPQSSSRCVWVKPRSMSRAEAVAQIVHTVEQAGMEREYARAIASRELLNDRVPTVQMGRLLNFFCARIGPRYTPLEVVFDDTEEQQDTLLAETRAFRHRAHWLLGLGTLALIVWLVGRVGVLMWRTKRRTVEAIDEIDDPEIQLTGRFGANVGAGGFVWLLAVTLTVAVFCIGVIVLLANM